MSRRSITWRPPPGDWLKTNVDGVYSRSTAEGATAVVIRDNSGKLLTGESMRIRAYSSLAAEAEAMRRALILATNLNMEQILIESDNLPLVQAVKSKTYIGEVESILRDIFLLAESLSNCGFTWVPREGNKVANGVAKCSLTGRLEENWRRKPPREITEQLRSEALNQNGCILEFKGKKI
ncbi:hypothetical protein Ahy_Scaffold1g107111 [Arachis hypogaea]|uniref:RNase H type-1 domain-containing protein n=1 Tax=Arachis hypogaea TaxID=3818 RepID=A0A444WUG7_ARAHY|nr:hypothetical protein Ahy_Scaffold1g107111 [Arachis hypogaea]